MALDAFLKITGQKQGAIKGSVTQKGREGKIMVIAANHELVSPRDPASGMATGKRRHHPFIITKELDKSSPLLYQAMVTNEMITDWELQFWTAAATKAAGTEKQHYTVRLKNANISAIRFIMPNNKIPELVKLNEYEELEFIYETIEWTWTDGGITATDTWQAV
ncbi:MAG: type VI secretion system tube protein TssD [Chitinophagaceae bacterium]